MTDRIYLDYAASAPLHPEVLDAMLPWLGLSQDSGFGNAASLSWEGKQARQALEEARASIAASIGASPLEITFTSGGTESDNSLIVGICAGVRQLKGRQRGGNLVVASAIEHHAVLEPLRALHRDGWQTELVRPTRQGIIEPDALAATIHKHDDTICTLVTVMASQNEIGSIQPIAELAVKAHENGALIHTDAVQALGKLPFDVTELGIDAASFSAHKLGGPKGVGAFYLRSLTPFQPQMLGGNQERGLRSGTANVAGAVGLAKALELAVASQEAEAKRLGDLRERLSSQLNAISPRVKPSISPATECLPNIFSIIVDKIDSETMIMRLDRLGFAVSGGSACSSGSLEPSHVLLALGVSRDQAQSVLRLSFGHGTTASDIDAFCAAFAEVIGS